MESDSIRARRLEIARDEAIAMKQGPNHLIGVSTPEVVEPEPAKIMSPVEAACFDALLFSREGLSREYIIDMIMMRNRISKADTEKIVDQVLSQKLEPEVKLGE